MTTPVFQAAAEQPTRQKRRTRSYSQLGDFLHCGWAFRLKRVKRVPEHPSVWLAGGKAFHSATEDFDNACWQENDLSQYDDPSQWTAAFAQHFDAYLDEMREENPDVPESSWRTAGRKTQAKPNGEDIDWWRENGAQMVVAYVRWRVENNHRLRIADLGGGVPAIELEVDMPLGGVPMRGYIDRLYVDNDGNLLLVDYKTGSRVPVTPLQLATYALQLERRVGQPVKWGAFYDARRGSMTEPISLARFDQALLGDVYRHFDRAANQGLFLPNIGTHCSACGVRDACVFRGGVEPTNGGNA